MKDKSGIYSIINTANGKRYIGQAKDIEGRIKHHKSRLNHGKHKNCHLQAAWYKYKAESFVFQVVELTPADNLNAKESYWIEFFKATEREYGYNLDTVNLSGSTTRSEETKRKIGLASVGRIVTPETRKAISEAGKLYRSTAEYKIQAAAVRSKVVYDLLNVETGERFNDYNLSAFCNDRGYHNANIYRVINSKRNHYKGWYLRDKAEKAIYEMILEAANNLN